MKAVGWMLPARPRGEKHRGLKRRANVSNVTNIFSFATRFARHRKGDFLEVLKVIDWFFDGQNEDKVDTGSKVAIAGHSSGARAVLMAAAVKDVPTYLQHDEDLDPLLTENLLAAAQRIGASIANHPDQMYNPVYVPQAGYDITETPTMIITGSHDILIEEENR